MLSKIMRRAHELVNQMEGNNRAAKMSLALQQAWEESRKPANTVTRYNVLSVEACVKAYGKKPSEIKGHYFSPIDEIWTLPVLSGSEKQISWAIDIRKAYLNRAEGYILRACTNKSADKQPKKADVLDAFAKLENQVNAHTDSKFWIDNRNNF